MTASPRTLEAPALRKKKAPRNCCRHGLGWFCPMDPFFEPADFDGPRRAGLALESAQSRRVPLSDTPALGQRDTSHARSGEACCLASAVRRRASRRVALPPGTLPGAIWRSHLGTFSVHGPQSRNSGASRGRTRRAGATVSAANARRRRERSSNTRCVRSRAALVSERPWQSFAAQASGLSANRKAPNMGMTSSEQV